jgi:D-glycero-alpha-D-manno-heptose 1-phosphate guanylyltransferase
MSEPAVDRGRGASALWRDTVAIVLAGGFGTRVRHLLPESPKPMAPVAGRPFLEWVIRLLAHAGISRAVISTGYRAEVISEYFGQHPVPGIAVQCVAETEPLGTAGGSLHAARGSGWTAESWLVLNGDSIAFANLDTVARTWSAAPGLDGLLLGKPMPDATRYGTLRIGAADGLLGFEEKRPGPGVINLGIYLLRDRVLAGFPARRPLSFERDVFPALTTRGAVMKVLVMDAPFLDIGTPETLPLAGDFIRQHQAQFGLA